MNWIKSEDGKPNSEDDVLVTYEWDDEPGKRFLGFGFLSEGDFYDENGPRVWQLWDSEGNKIINHFIVIAWAKVEPLAEKSTPIMK